MQLRLVKQYHVTVESYPAAHCHQCGSEIPRFSMKAIDEWKRDVGEDGTITRWKTGRSWCSPTCQAMTYADGK